MSVWSRIMQGDEAALAGFAIACLAGLALAFLVVSALGY